MSIDDDLDLDAPATAGSVWQRPGTIAAAVFLSAVVVFGVVIAIWPGGTGDETGEPHPAPTGLPDQSPAAPDGAVLTEAPDDVSWELFGPVAVPVSATHGPATDTGTVAYGFARSPEGALVAAAQIMARAGINVPRQTWEPTIEHQFVDDDARVALLEAMRAAADAAGDPADVAASEVAAYAGFSYRAWTADVAVIELALDVGNASYAGVTVTLHWIDGDWRMQAPPGGSWSPQMRSLPDLTGFVLWGAR